MFFSSKTSNAIVTDHRSFLDELEMVGEVDSPLQLRKEAFARMVPKLASHVKREENAIYSYMKDSGIEDLADFALKGKEEHLIVDHLIEEMNSPSLSDVEWSAKASVLFGLIEGHIVEEENEVCPLLTKTLDKKTDEALCAKFEAPFDSEFDGAIDVEISRSNIIYGDRYREESEHKY